MKIRPSINLVGALILLASLGASLTASAQLTPTNFEQYQLELINRARMEPAAEVSRLSVATWGDNLNNVPGSAFPQPQTPNLNEGLPAGTISTAAKQPLAFNLNLVQAARNYSTALLSSDFPLTHTLGGTTPESRMIAAGYQPSSSGENLALQASSQMLPISAAITGALHQDLFIDNDVPGRGHRLNLMNPAWREIGIGIAADTDYSGLGPELNAVMTTQDFAVRAGDAFLTGVVFNDTVLVNDFYTPGEGLGNVTISATRIGDGSVFATTTFSSGGYTLQLAPGTYSVSAIGSFGTDFLGTISIADQNVKIDAINPIPEPVTIALLAQGILAALLGFQRRGGPANR